MIANLKKALLQQTTNIRGWRTNRKLLVIESDDWGSIRMPSKEVFEIFEKKGYALNRSIYNRFDSLESEDDLAFLFETLHHFKDKNSNPLIFTANCVVANPDFDKIKSSGFEKYSYELVSETFKKYASHNKCVDLWKEGIYGKVFLPQFHGREHLNIKRWMNEIRKPKSTSRFCFDHQTTYIGGNQPDYNFMEALDFDNVNELPELLDITVDGLTLFRQVFGFNSKSFISPCYTWHSAIEPALKENGVDYIQGGIFQIQPPRINNKYKKKYHYMGEQSLNGQLYLIRNCFFEPTTNPTIDSVGQCINQIANAFRWKKPAIISSHRINYIGSLHEDNRNHNLMLLRQLITTVQKRWPDVEFMTTDKLGDLISSSEENRTESQ